MHKTSLFIFRRDLRLEDNTGLIYALENSKQVICCFIFSPEQIKPHPYQSKHCLQFMIESLEDLEKQILERKGKLFFFFDDPEKIVGKCLQTLDVEAVIVNRDYTPYSQKRDKKIEMICKQHGAAFRSFDDALLHPPETTLKKDQKPYTVFTPFFQNAQKQTVQKPRSNRKTNYFLGRIPFAKTGLYSKILPKRNQTQAVLGGRKEALEILKNLSRLKEETHLSPHMKFTTCSPREVYWAMKKEKKDPLIRALYWRDFFTQIAFYFPHVFRRAFREKFDALSWSKNKKAFELWCQGKTGFPFVDAGMREMHQTGWMPNRLRMVTASFLVKDLHLSWQWGEKYFAQTLLDYDPAVNNGNWQWVASTGCDAQPYFRVFNPWTQQKKFDPQCEYIKKWLPELKDLPPKVIHEWFLKKHHSLAPDYPPPMIDHQKEAKKAISAYTSV